MSNLTLPRLVAPILLWALALCAGLTTASGVASGQSWGVAEEDDTSQEERAHGVRGVILLGGGWAYTPRTNDPPGAIRLVGGSAFPGYALRFSGGVQLPLPSVFSLQAEAGVQRTATEGYASIEEPGDAGPQRFRRELAFELISLDMLGLLRATHALSPSTHLWFGAGVGLRAGVHGRAEERRIGFFDSEPAPRIRLAPALLLPLEAGLGVRAGPVEIPLAIRLHINPGYGSTTAGRLDGDATEANPGRYWVESTYQVLFLSGVVF